ncbi:hypothetical protein [Capybara microvirus Cap3_SP_414]|nr:hypothetical protein [Capybara microvirus Cap3_SP_414]
MNYKKQFKNFRNNDFFINYDKSYKNLPTIQGDVNRGISNLIQRYNRGLPLPNDAVQVSFGYTLEASSPFTPDKLELAIKSKQFNNTLSDVKTQLEKQIKTKELEKRSAVENTGNIETSTTS